MSRGGEIFQLGAGMLAAKTHDLSSTRVPSLEPSEVEAESQLLSADLYTCACTHTQTQNKYIKQTKNKRVKYLFKQVFPFITKKKQKSHRISGQYLQFTLSVVSPLLLLLIWVD